MVPGTIPEDLQLTLWEAITERHAAKCVAGLFKNSNDELSTYVEWYHRWHIKTSAPQIVEDIPLDQLPKIQEIINRIKKHPVVVDVIPED